MKPGLYRNIANHELGIYPGTVTVNPDCFFLALKDFGSSLGEHTLCVLTDSGLLGTLCTRYVCWMEFVRPRNEGT